MSGRSSPVKASAIILLLVMAALPILLLRSDENAEARNQEWSLDLNSVPEKVYDDTIYCFMGSKPVHDGVVTAEDGWEATIPTIWENSDGEIKIRIRSKHDGERIYFLIENTRDISGYASNEHIDHIYFEDDGTYPERELDSENEDCKYVGVYGAPESFCDAHHLPDGGWSVANELHSNRNGGAMWSSKGNWNIGEWWTDLCSGSIDDISVTGNETLGFATGRGSGWPNGYFEKNNASTWGSLHVVFSQVPTRINMTYPGDGDLIRIGEEIEMEFKGEADSIEFRWDDTSWIPMEEGDPIPTDGLSDGDHGLEVRCTGKGGERFSNGFEIRVDSEIPDFSGIKKCIQGKETIGIALGWDPAVDENPPINYNIYLHREGMTTGDFLLYDTTNATKFVFNDYYRDIRLTFRIRAVDAAGWEDLNDVTMSMTPDHSLPPLRDIDLTSIGTTIESEDVFCFNGERPMIDGRWTDGEDWDRVPATIIEDHGKQIHLRAMHDQDSMYLLFISTAGIEPINLYFEDDGKSPLKSLDSSNEDCKFYSGSYSVREHGDGRYKEEEWVSDHPDGGIESMVHVSTDDGIEMLEWSIPLCTGGTDDINVSSDETLGFAVFGPASFPDSPDQFDPATWGSLHVIYDDFVGGASLFGPPDGSTIDPTTTFGLHVAVDDVDVEYRINGEYWIELDIPYILTGKVLSDGNNTIEFRYKSGRTLLGTFEASYNIDPNQPFIKIREPSSGSSFQVPCTISLQAVAVDSAMGVEFYYLDQYFDQIYIGDAEYSYMKGGWECEWNTVNDTSPKKVYAVVYGPWDSPVTSGIVLISFYQNIDDDDVIIPPIIDDDEDIDIVVDDDDDYDPIDYGEEGPDSDLFFVISIIAGIVAVIVVVIVAIMMALNEKKEIKDRKAFFPEKNEDLKKTANHARKVTPEHIRPKPMEETERPANRKLPDEKTEFEPDEEDSIPMTEAPVIEEEPVMEEEPSRLEDELIEEDEEDANTVYSKGGQVEAELHKGEKYLKEDGVVGGHIGADEQ